MQAVTFRRGAAGELIARWDIQYDHGPCDYFEWRLSAHGSWMRIGPGVSSSAAYDHVVAAYELWLANMIVGKL